MCDGQNWACFDGLNSQEFRSRTDTVSRDHDLRNLRLSQPIVIVARKGMADPRPFRTPVAAELSNLRCTMFSTSVR